MLRKNSVISLFLSVFVFFNVVHSTTLLPSISSCGGENHTLVLTKNGWVWACGRNGVGGEGYHGVLGLGEDANNVYYELQRVHGPNDVNFLENICATSSGWMHSLALDDVNGTVRAWGDGTFGELGNGLFYGNPEGEEPIFDGESTPVRVLAGQQDTNDANSLLRGIIGISAGRSGEYSLAVDTNHFVFSWGRGKEGQLGNGQNSQNYNKPVRVYDGEMEADSNFLENIICISAGEQHSMALEKIEPKDPNDPNDANDPNCTGRVYTWGDNDYGKLGINDYVSLKVIPVKVHGVNDVNYLQNIVAISAGWDHCMALEKIDDNDPNYRGRVYCWGNNDDGERGCEGGRLGNGQISGSSPVPVIVLGGEQDPNNPDANLQNIIAISAGESHCMALEKFYPNDPNCKGRVYTWGDNDYGQLGTGNRNDSNTPVKVLAPDRNGDGLPDDLDGDANTIDYLGDDFPIVLINAGYWHCLAIDSLGRIYSWGMGQNGALGLGDGSDRTIPVWIPIMDESDDCSSIDIYPDPSYGDGIVNFLDFTVLANAWLTGSGNDEVDFVDDGVIDNKDLNVFCDCWLYATSWYLYNCQQSLGGEEQQSQMEEILADSDQMAESQEDQTESQESEPPAIYLFSEVNEPNSGDEVTVQIYTDTPLFCMMAGITVTGDANITGAMSTADCNSYGWDPGWDSEPYIDPAGWVCINGVSWPAEANGVVGYIKFRYNSGEVTVSIMTESEAFDTDWEPVPFSTETLTFGTDPNEP